MPKFSRSHWAGAETSIFHLSAHLRPLGYESEVWTSDVFGDPADEMWEDLRVRRFPSIYLSRSEKAAAGQGKAALSLPLLGAVIRDRSIDLLHMHTHNRVTALLLVLARSRGLRTILTLHSEFRDLRPRWRYAFPNEYAIRNADHVITVNEKIARSLRTHDLRTEAITVIPNGVDIPAFEAGDGAPFRKTLGLTDEPLVLTPGRICDVKNQHSIVEVLESAVDRVPNLHWAIVGVPSDQAYHRALQDLIARRGLGDRVHVIPGLPPESPELADAYAAADLVAVTSKHEAFPLVVLEAWAARKAVVATRVGGLPEVIDPDVNGWLVPPGKPREMADAISDLIGSGAERARFGEAGREKAERHSWRAIAREVAAVYDEVLAPMSASA